MIFCLVVAIIVRSCLSNSFNVELVLEPEDDLNYVENITLLQNDYEENITGKNNIPNVFSFFSRRRKF